MPVGWLISPAWRAVEIAGYGARAVAEDKTDQLGPYVAQSILLLVAPALYAASIYMALGRLMRSVQAERHSLVPVRWLTRAFVAGDVLSFLIQSTGGGLMGSGNFDQKTAQNIVLGGLIVQIVMFGLFAVTTVVFDARIRRWPTAASLRRGGRRWRRTMKMLYATTALILVRSVVRVVEYVLGRGGYLLRNEWTLYVFDATPMLAVTLLYASMYPADLTAENTKPPSPVSGHQDMELADGSRTGGGDTEKRDDPSFAVPARPVGSRVVEQKREGW